MNQTITPNWIPSKRSTDALKSRGYSVKQLNHIRRCFIRRHLNKELSDASSQYSAMVKASGSGHDIKHKTPDSEIEQDQKREKDLKNKPDNAKERAEEVKTTGDVMSQEQAIAFYNRGRKPSITEK